MLQTLISWLDVDTVGDMIWLAIGLAGQMLFTGRFIVQWIASERARRSVVPLAFWYFSITGGTIVLIYAIHRHDPVFIMGQSLGIIIYARNLWLIRAERSAA